MPLKQGSNASVTKLPSFSDKTNLHLELPSFSFLPCVLAELRQSPKTPESQKYEKITKKNTKSPTPGLGPENTKKLRKKYKIGQFWAIFVFFFYFRGPTRGGRFCIFFRNFFVFLGFRGFWALSQLRKHPILARDDRELLPLADLCLGGRRNFFYGFRRRGIF